MCNSTSYTVYLLNHFQERFINDNMLINEKYDALISRDLCTTVTKCKSILITVTNRIKELRGIIAECEKNE